MSGDRPVLLLLDHRLEVLAILEFLPLLETWDPNQTTTGGDNARRSM
jgi:hypothetical protein